MIPKLETCPVCGVLAAYLYGGFMSDSTRLVKVRCPIGCVEQTIFYCDEKSASRAWNFRQPVKEKNNVAF